MNPATRPEGGTDSPMLTPDALDAASRPCPCRYRGGTVEAGPAGATWTEPCEHRGVRQEAEGTLRRFLRAQDRDALAATIAQAWLGDVRYVGDATGAEWDAAYRVVDALLGRADPPAPAV